jgi:uncharacterized protein YkwD
MLHRTWFIFFLISCPTAFGQSVDERNGEAVRSGETRINSEGSPDLTAVTRAILEQTNAFRQQKGREALTSNDKLTATAKYFAEYMARTNEYGHEADGKKPAERAKEHGYDYCLLSENIAYAFDPTGFSKERLTEIFVNGWKDSPGHRKNMIDRDVSEIGVAVARSEDTGYFYAVQMFGRPRSAAVEFRIENKAGETIEYVIGEQLFTLPSQYIRTHTRCRPTELTFRWPDEETKTVKPESGEHLLITREDGKYQVAKLNTS